MTSLWTRTRVWVANRLLDLGLIEAAKWVAPKRWGRPSGRSPLPPQHALCHRIAGVAVASVSEAAPMERTSTQRLDALFFDFVPK